MNWIATWCNQRCGRNERCDRCSKECAPRFEIAKAVGCSEQLVWMLMNHHDCVTQVNIANRIADYLGATEEQRDSIVAPKHRGTWKPNPKRKAKKPRARRKNPRYRTVVAVDCIGNVVRRFPSLRSAGAYVGMTGEAIAYRCNHLHTEKDEFENVGITFRYENEWEKMTTEERIRDLMKRR